MSLFLQGVTIALLGIYISIEVERIKTNKEVIESNKKVHESFEATKCKIEERNNILKIQNEEIIKIKEHFEEIKCNISIDHNKLTEEVIKRINENAKKISGEEMARILKNSFKV